MLCLGVDMLCVIIELPETPGDIPGDRVLCDVGPSEVVLELRLVLGRPTSITVAAIKAPTIAMNVTIAVTIQH